MKDIRYFLRNGDSTTTGGKLIVTGRGYIDMGLAVGSEGDVATCPACGSTGTVFNDCYPGFSLEGRQALVSGARVFCKCSKKPLVIETQRDAYVELDSVVERRPDRPSQPAYLAATSDDDDEVVEQYLEVRNLISGECVHDLHYALYVNGERIIDDETINLGCTVAVKGHCTVAAIMWHEGWAV